MKALLVFTLLVTTFATASIGLTQGENLNIATANKLFEKQQDETAFELIKQACLEEEGEGIIRLWIEKNKSFLQGIAIQNRSTTKWTPCTECRTISLENIKGKDLLKGWAFAILGDGLGAIGGYAVYKDKQRALQLEYEQNNPVPLPDMNQIEKKIHKYEILRTSIESCTACTKHNLITASIEKRDSLIDLLQKIQELKKESTLKRKDFISYDIASPHIARASQLVFIADQANTLSIGHSEEALRQAARVLVQGSYADILQESQDDVKEQFIETFRKIKELAGKAELEELQVLQTLHDKISSESKRGPDRWWN